ncbi:ABC transporter permease [Pseudoclavibacter sp. 13-3]|uniref:ABC transporter permease n=1 Tax=Pseudoclavibacter sp. 13-3 TaxID=2901228 RepID=UPI001E540724|nr:ABC transporter permease [Pseudoclavibacter sp. 13-3]MCD7101416.1 ABC transporter permease [Pseudoclavibacter sp. 13-3]
MNPAEVLRSAWHGIAANPLRSLLTMLGVLIGVASVILLLAVGNGSAAKIQSAIDGLGTTTLTVRPSGQGSSLTTDVADRVAAAKLGHIDKVVPQVSTSQTVSAAGNSSDSVSVVGTTPDYFSIGTSTVASGSAFTEAEADLAAKVVVIGQTTATDLFGSVRSALGSTLQIDGTSYTVKGILKSQSSSTASDADSVVIAPLKRIQRSFTGFDDISTLTVTATNADSVSAAEGELTVLLDQLMPSTASTAETSSAQTSGSARSGTSSSTATYQIVNQSSLLETQAASAQSFTTLLGAVAAISLLVGGIGVTNVMLVSVTERTREIGIRKALGATRGVILSQFLVEAALLTLAGGIVGVGIACIGSTFEINGTEPVILGWSIPLALGVSVAIGVFFGAYPAGRAASLRPIQALRAD